MQLLHNMNCIQKIADAIGEQDKQYIRDAYENLRTSVHRIREELQRFDESLEGHPTAQLWLMYTEMVLIFKRYIKTERAGKWQEHLDEEGKMLPYMVCAGHTKYVACIPHSLHAMRT